MVRYKSDCVDCGLPCIGSACQHYRVRVLECDQCHDEVEKLYVGVSGRELCADCALNEMDVVE